MCLRYLHELLLIRSSNADFLNVDQPLPKSFFLTESGHLYINHLLTTTDYLVTVVMDIRLKHDQLKQQPNLHKLNEVSFIAQLSSLLEYTENVKRTEEIQIQRLIDLDGSANTLLPL